MPPALREVLLVVGRGSNVKDILIHEVRKKGSVWKECRQCGRGRSELHDSDARGRLLEERWCRTNHLSAGRRWCWSACGHVL